MTSKLAKLTYVKNLREIWKNEATDFTNWLSEPENLKLLGDTVGCELELIRTEAGVGKFNVDILAKDTTTNRNVIIENQLEETNHDHLGKVITYASGHDAALAIWIVKRARDEHINAVKWLNDKTDDDIGFFLLEIEALKVDNSLPAVRFNVVVRPNEWAKAVKADSTSNSLTDTKQMQLELWSKFKQFAEEQKTPFSYRTPRGQHWYDLSFGTQLAHIALTVSTRDNCIRCGIYIERDKDFFHFLESQKEYIENSIGEKCEWIDADVASRIYVMNPVKDPLPENEDARKVIFQWFLSKAILFRKIFLPLVKNFKK